MVNYDVTYLLTAPAGTKGFVEVFEVPPARRFHVQKVKVHFLTSTGGQLGVALYYGNAQIIPRQGLIRGDSAKVELDADFTYVSGDKIILYYQNDDTSNDHKAFIVIEGELE